MTGDRQRRPRWFRVAAFACLVVACIFGAALLRHPETPLPPEWNVFEPLQVSAPLTPLTGWKLDWAASDPALCQSVLAQAAQVQSQPNLVVSDTCGIAPRVTVQGIGGSTITPVETTCAVALRLAMWEHHGLQPAAQALFGSAVRRVHHVGSYNCRPIRGSQTRWSTHATAEAIDITGFDLADGRRIRLISDWTGDSSTAAFLRRVRDSACIWFQTTLGPDYNSLHADHFHLQSRGWGTCR